MAKTIDFTIRAIEALPSPSKGRDEYKDSKVPGLYLRITPTGVRSFSFVGRAKGSNRVERLTLGKFPAVKPEQARDRARQVAGQLAGGTSVADVARDKRGELTLNQLSKEYLKDLKQRTRRPDEFELFYEQYVAPHFGQRRLSDIRPADVARWFRDLPDQIVRRREQEVAERAKRKAQRRAEIAARQAVRRHGPDPKAQEPFILSAGRVTGKTTANHAIGALRAMYNWAKKPQTGLFQGINPAEGIAKYPKVHRERFLTPTELGPFFEALAAEPSVDARDCTLIKLLTGARRSNVEEMRWSEVDLQAREWRIPRTKNNDPQTVPLVDEAVELLKARKEGAKSVFVFASKKSKTGHLVNTAKSWKRLLQRAGLVDVRQHDLRRTLGSWQARTGASLVLIGKSLNHRDPRTTSIYARLDIDPVRDSVTRATSAMLEAAGLKASADVIQLPTPVKGTAAKKARGKP